MKGHSCLTCTRRKVRCDRDEPCSNCKRRKQDKCVYPDTSPNDRIKRLEILVRSLGGDPEDGAFASSTNPETSTPAVQAPTSNSNSEARPLFPADNEPVIEDCNGDGQKTYLESSAWYGWLGKEKNHLVVNSRESQSIGATAHVSSKPNVLNNILRSDEALDLSARHPQPQVAEVLWTTYMTNVNPLMKIGFDWELEALRSVTLANEASGFSYPEHAFVFATYTISILSMRDSACKELFGTTKARLLSEHQMLCEHALARSDFLCTSDFMVLQALALFIASGMDRLCTASLWSLMGMTVRIAERLGLHRDGEHLKLPPAETERRRRLWWQLQHLDLGIAVRQGATPLTLMASWDTKMPLNIEDEDISPEMTNPPPARKGLTNMSQCLWTFWVIQSQRSYFGSTKTGVGLSWASDRSTSETAKLDVVKRMEDGLNENFLQYCDPIKPLDMFVQLAARGTIYGLRRMVLHPLGDPADSAKDGGKKHAELVDSCVKCLEYDVAFHRNPAMDPFEWRYKNFFPWGALICVALAASRQQDPARGRRIWTMLADLYSANLSLSEFAEDQRRVHAAELIVSAWKARSNHLATLGPAPTKPNFVISLEVRLAETHAKARAQKSELLPRSSGAQLPPTPATTSQSTGIPTPNPNGLELDALLDDRYFDDLSAIDFDQIDWAFWNSVDGMSTDMTTWPAPS